MNKQTSFTLIELLVVIVIIGILAGVIMISTASSVNKANISKLKVFENSIDNNLAANMVSRWKLDQIIGAAAPYTTSDAWGSNTGTLGDGITATTYPTLLSESECVTKKCMDFDGLGNYISIPDNNSLRIYNEITMEGWINASSISSTYYSGLLRKETSYLIMFNPTKTVSTYIYLEGVGWRSCPSPNTITYGVWHHIVGTYDGNTIKIFLDGRSNQLTNVGKINLSTANLQIGHGYFGGGVSYLFDGLIDDVRIYSAALSTSQIKQNYIAGLDSLLSNENISKEEYNERINVLAYE